MKLRLPCWIEVVTTLYPNPKIPSQIAKEVDITLSHVFKIVTQLEKLGYVTTDKPLRSKTVTLTKEGIKLFKICVQILPYKEV